MATPSSIETHPQSARIIEDISNGVSGVEIARRYGVSESAISRYKVARKHVLARIIEEDGVDASDILGRLLDLSDSARTARKLADATGTPAVRARTIATELSVLDKLNRLSVDDIDMGRLAAAVGPMIRVLGNLANRYPKEVLAALAQHAELTELADSLKTALKGQTGTTA